MLRYPTHDATSIGRRKTWKHGRMQRKRLTRSRFELDAFGGPESIRSLWTPLKEVIFYACFVEYSSASHVFDHTALVQCTRLHHLPYLASSYLVDTQFRFTGDNDMVRANAPEQRSQGPTTNLSGRHIIVFNSPHVIKYINGIKGPVKMISITEHKASHHEHQIPHHSQRKVKRNHHGRRPILPVLVVVNFRFNRAKPF